MGWLSPERYASELESETARLATAVARQQPVAVVPACPDWTVRDLVSHVGTGHRYASAVIEQAMTAPLAYRLEQAPEEQRDWGDWLAAGARRLNDAVRERGFESPVWTFQPAHRTAGFWLRRMVHDLIIHRFDAEPGGEPAADLAADLAADGIDDLLLVLATVAGPDSPHPLLRQLTGAGETLLFIATDSGDRWRVTLTPAGFTGDRGDATTAAVTCRAPVADLLLMINRRRVPGTDQVHGDRAVLDRWLDLIRFWRTRVHRVSGRWPFRGGSRCSPRRSGRSRC